MASPQQEDVVTSTTTFGLDDILLQPPKDVCKRDIVYKERRVKSIEIVYTDIFLDVINYSRDKRLLQREILRLPYSDREDVGDGVHIFDGSAGSSRSEKRHFHVNNNTLRRKNVVIVCATPLNTYLSGVERACGRSLPCAIKSMDTDIYVCDIGMEGVPDHVDLLVTFNIDPFEVCGSGTLSSSSTDRKLAKFRRVFKHFMSADIEDDGTVQLVFSVFSLNERALETFSAANNVDVTLTDVRFVFVNDNTDRKAIRNIVCNYCTDLMLCLNSDMRSFVVDGEMPPVVDLALASDPLNLIVLKIRQPDSQTSPESEYFRFKQFYHTFAYDKKSKWGVEMENNNDERRKNTNTDLWRHIYSWNDALQLELVRLFKVLRRAARQKMGARMKKYLSRYIDTPTVSISYKDTMTDEEESEEMIRAREKLFEAYRACPVLMSTVDLRSIAMLGNDAGKTLLKRDQRRLLVTIRHAGSKSSERDVGVHETYTLTSQKRIYDTMTYPCGGNVSDTNTLDILFAKEISLSGCLVVKYRPMTANAQIMYNRFFGDLLHVS